jgi:hypothetical protein
MICFLYLRINKNNDTMARIAGIQFEKDARGNRRYVRIDLKKHGNDIAPFLEKVGAVDIDEFEKEWATSVSGDRVRKELNTHIDMLFSHDR